MCGFLPVVLCCGAGQTEGRDDPQCLQKRASGSCSDSRQDVQTRLSFLCDGLIISAEMMPVGMAMMA